MQTRYSLEQKKYNITFRINLILDLLVFFELHRLVSW